MAPRGDTLYPPGFPLRIRALASDTINSPVSQSWPWWRWALLALNALALALSTYLSWHYVSEGSVIGCGGGSPCDEVLNSRWSLVAGVPVSGLAMGAYVALLVASLASGPAAAMPVRLLAWRAMLILVGAVAGSAVWFTIVQRWIIGRFCPYCMATHLTGLVLAALVIWRAPKQLHENSKTVAPGESASLATRRPRRVASAVPALGWSLLGAAFASILVACQIALGPYATVRGGDSGSARSAVDPHTAPVVGSPDARYVVTLLFDYQCPHCQQLHLMLDEAIRRYSGKLAFALCPAPLNSQCNPYVTRDTEQFRDSCELARIALAVWRAKRDAFPIFDRWMFSLESGDFWRPRKPDAARAKAIALVGQAKFDAARTDPWIDRYLQTSVRIYGDTIQGSSAVPKLVFGSHWAVPEPRAVDDVLTILQESLNVPKP
jgi:uncharacterized membrane protein/protein-disulfide isomerase